MAFSRVFDYVHVTGRDLDLDVLKMYSSTRMKFVGQGIQNKIRPWPWLNDLGVRTWPTYSEDAPAYRKSVKFQLNVGPGVWGVAKVFRYGMTSQFCYT